MSVRNVLIVGGGVTGLTSSIALARQGIEVTLIERAPAWARVGHGITVQGNALRVFKELGVVDEMLQRGFGFGDMTMYRADGGVLAVVQTPRTGGDDLPPTLGALRADLHEVLLTKAAELGVEIRLGTELASFESDATSATAVLSDGTTETRDLIILAEGIKSPSRAKLGITEKNGPTGLGIWRAVTERQPDMLGGLAYGGAEYKAGYTPISDTHCYTYVLTKPQRTDNDLPDWQEMRRLMESYHGPWDFLRESIDETRFLNFQEIEWIMVEGPWHRGRVIAIGESVHAVPPLIAQGAAQCTEDALVLAEYLAERGDIEKQLTAFQERRLPRIRGVVEASLELRDIEIGKPSARNPAIIMEEALGKLMERP